MSDISSIQTLFQSLSQGERTFIKRSRMKVGKKYRKLFDLLTGSASRTEEDLRRKSGITDRSAYAFAKHYLVSKVTDAILEQGMDQTLNQPRHELERAKVLFERSLFRMSLKHLIRCKRGAKRVEDHLLLMDALNLEQLVWQFAGQAERRPLPVILEEKQDVLERIRFTEHARSLNARMLYLFQTVGVGRTHEEEEQYRRIYLEALRILEQPAPEGTITGGVYLLNCLVYYYNVKGDLESSKQNLQALVDLIDAHPDTLPSSFTFYVSSLNNLILVHLYLKEFGSAEYLIRKLHSLASDSIKDQNALFICKYNTGFELFEKSGELHRSYEMSKALKEEYPEYARRLSPVYTGHLLYYAFRSCFQVKKLREAQQWLNEILHSRAEAKPEVMAIARISELVLAYERGNFETLESLVRNAERHFSRSGSTLKFESAMLSFFKEHAHHEAKKPAWEKLSKELSALKDDPLEQKVFSYFDMLGWVGRKRDSR